MRPTSTRVITSLVASAALAGGLLAVGAGAAAAAVQPGARSTAARLSQTAGHDPSSTATAPADVGPGDLRVWETAHAAGGLASPILPGDIRVWELRHSTPS
jgi:hypothetical protein